MRKVGVLQRSSTALRANRPRIAATLTSPLSSVGATGSFAEVASGPSGMPSRLGGGRYARTRAKLSYPRCGAGNVANVGGTTSSIAGRRKELNSAPMTPARVSAGGADVYSALARAAESKGDSPDECEGIA